MEHIDKIVDYKKYCETCKYRDADEFKDECPCDECLDNPTNVHTSRPVCYKEDEKLKKKNEKIEE